MQQTKRIVIVAGEESGDLHAASFVKSLLSKHPHLQISGIGGKHMEEAGVHLIREPAYFGVTGISAVIRHLRDIRKTYQLIKAHLSALKPDLLILVDCPGFNLRLAEFAKQQLGLRTLYYISPQIWAWKAGRIHRIRASVDHMAVILPFEKAIYEKAGVPVSFVGHPLVDKILPCEDIPHTRRALGLPENKRLIAMLPGSRQHEIELHMPVLQKTAQQLSTQFDDLHVVIPVASSINPSLIESYLKKTTIPYTLIPGRSIETVGCSDYVIVASGTASLECALLVKPMCIIYKVSTLSYVAACQFIKVKFLGLCNLLKNEMIVPELLQYDCNPTELTRTMVELMTNKETSERMEKRLAELKLSLSAQEADCTMTSLIEREIL